MTQPRARDLGIPFDGKPGALNAITDVAGVEVGFTTLHDGDGPLVPGQGPVRTGVTAILPRGRNGVGKPCAAGTFTLNGNGEMTGRAWIEESGSLNMPIVLTNTHSVGAAHSGVIAWLRNNASAALTQWALPVVAETWDGYLNDINGQHVTPDHVVDALDGAKPGPVAEGNVGGGTGMNAYGFKGGSGTSSRLVQLGARTFTVGAFVQANHASRHELVVAGRRLGADSHAPSPIATTPWLEQDGQRNAAPGGAGSIIVVVATDAPLLPNQLTAMAKRVSLGVGRAGTSGGHFSGDIFVAFSTANDGSLDSRFPMNDSEFDAIDSMEFIPWGIVDALYEATVQATDEAIVNALVAAKDMVGRDGHASFALPHDEIRRAFTA